MNQRTECMETKPVHVDEWQAWTRLRKRNGKQASHLSVQSICSEKKAKMAAKVHLKGLPYTF